MGHRQQTASRAAIPSANRVSGRMFVIDPDSYQVNHQRLTAMFRITILNSMHCSRNERGQFLLSALLIASSVLCAWPQSPAGDSNASATSSLKYPTAGRDSHIDDYHAEKVADPYRWMEQLDSPETREWVQAEARLTDSY